MVKDIGHCYFCLPYLWPTCQPLVYELLRLDYVQGNNRFVSPYIKKTITKGTSRKYFYLPSEMLPEWDRHCGLYFAVTAMKDKSETRVRACFTWAFVPLKNLHALPCPGTPLFAFNIKGQNKLLKLPQGNHKDVCLFSTSFSAINIQLCISFMTINILHMMHTCRSVYNSPM